MRIEPPTPPCQNHPVLFASVPPTAANLLFTYIYGALDHLLLFATAPQLKSCTWQNLELELHAKYMEHNHANGAPPPNTCLSF